MRKIDTAASHPLTGGAYTDTIVAMTSQRGEVPRKYFFVDAVVTPDGEWHEFVPEDGSKWDEQVGKWIEEANGECVATYYECHRQAH